jgi:hypothetical protein
VGPDTAALTRDSLLLRVARLQQELEQIRRERARDMGMVVADSPQARVDSAMMVRERVRVGIDFPRARQRPQGRENVLVEPGDSIHVPRYNPTVQVQGAVGVETKVLWREGADLGYYISQAGGYLEQAEKGRVWIRFANGEVATKGGGFLFFGGGIPDPDPGATINVPFTPPRERGPALSTGQLVGLITSVLGSITTVVVAAN